MRIRTVCAEANCGNLPLDVILLQTQFTLVYLQVPTSFFMKNDMKDGAYKVEVWLKDEAGAETTHRYEFTVKGGVVVSAPEADRAQNANPLQFLEQGPGQFYVKKL